MLGSGLSPRTVAFIGWFGPRGLASVIFALLALEDLPAEAERAVAVIGMTVLLSVFAHGLSAKPLAARYGASVTDEAPVPAGGEVPAHLPVRGLSHRHRAPDAVGQSEEGSR